jgi:hypothetical protein
MASARRREYFRKYLHQRLAFEIQIRPRSSLCSATNDQATG